MADAIRLTAKMMDVRDTMKRLFENRYAERVEVYRKAIRSSRQPGEPIMEAALRVCKRADKYADQIGEPIIALLCIAASVEECESPEEVAKQ